MEHDGGGEHTQGDEQRQEQALTLGLPNLEDMGFAIGQRFAKGGFGELFYGVRLSRHHMVSSRAGEIFWCWASRKSTGTAPENESVAIKCVYKCPRGCSVEAAKPRIASLANEVEVLAKLTGSLNVIHLYSACEDSDSVFVVMELCSGGMVWHTSASNHTLPPVFSFALSTFFKFIQLSSTRSPGERHYTENQVKGIMLDVVRTLAQCHGRNVVHRSAQSQSSGLKLPLHTLSDASDAKSAQRHQAREFSLASQR
jgi:serine/threonine protein kinase